MQAMGLQFLHGFGLGLILVYAINLEFEKKNIEIGRFMEFFNKNLPQCVQANTWLSVGTPVILVSD